MCVCYACYIIHIRLVEWFLRKISVMINKVSAWEDRERVRQEEVVANRMELLLCVSVVHSMNAGKSYNMVSVMHAWQLVEIAKKSERTTVYPNIWKHFSSSGWLESKERKTERERVIEKRMRRGEGVTRKTDNKREDDFIKSNTINININIEHQKIPTEVSKKIRCFCTLSLSLLFNLVNAPSYEWGKYRTRPGHTPFFIISTMCDTHI